MKNIMKLYILVLAVAFSLMGCDRITEPYTKSGDPVDPGDTTKVYVKAFLEDYTGARCGNCPAAAAKASQLQAIYGEKIIVVGVHAGSYAVPSGKYTYDFRTAEGNEYDNFFGVSAVGNPNGLINRTAVKGSKILYHSAWPSVVAEIVKQEADVKLELEANYIESSRTIQVTADMKYLNSAGSANYLTVLILEDSIVKYQKDYSLDPVPDIPDYVHNHVLRTSMNGAWGEQLSTNAIAKGTKFEKTYNLQIPETKDWRPGKLRIVAYVYDKNADYKVLQAEEVELIQ